MGEEQRPRGEEKGEKREERVWGWLGFFRNWFWFIAQRQPGSSKTLESYVPGTGRGESVFVPTLSRDWNKEEEKERRERKREKEKGKERK